LLIHFPEIEVVVLKIQIFSVGDANGAAAALKICYSGE